MFSRASKERPLKGLGSLAYLLSIVGLLRGRESEMELFVGMEKQTHMKKTKVNTIFSAILNTNKSLEMTTYSSTVYLKYLTEIIY